MSTLSTLVGISNGFDTAGNTDRDIYFKLTTRLALRKHQHRHLSNNTLKARIDDLREAINTVLK